MAPTTPPRPGVAPGLATFTATPIDLPGSKQYAPFSLQYPADWTAHDAPDENEYVLIDRDTGATYQYLTVGAEASTGSAAGDWAAAARTIRKGLDAYKSKPGFKIVSHTGDFQVGSLKATSTAGQVEVDGAPWWFRVIMIPAAPNGLKSGYLLSLSATGQIPGLDGPQDLGVKGEMAVIVQSFKPVRE